MYGLGLGLELNAFHQFFNSFCKNFFGMYTLLYLFGCARSSLVQRVFSSCGEWGVLSTCSAQSSHCGDVSCFRAQALGTWASVTVGYRLSCCNFLALWHPGFSNCSSQAPELEDFHWWHMGLVAPRHVKSSQTRDQTHVPCISKRILFFFFF